MSEAPQSMKRQLLMDFLGNFDDWIYTGWMISNADGATDGDTEVWESEWKNPIYPRSSFDKQAIPDTRNRCPCTTPIMWNCMIRNVRTGRVHVYAALQYEQEAMQAMPLRQSMQNRSLQGLSAQVPHPRSIP